jgi:hypothetical protein
LRVLVFQLFLMVLLLQYPILIGDFLKIFVKILIFSQK